MNQELDWIEQLAPDMIETMVQRFMIIRHIYWTQPVGRRTLAQEIGLTERVLRTETDFLKQQGLIETTRSGMIITVKGRSVLDGLNPLIDDLANIHQQEEELAQSLGIARCLIVAGDIDQQEKVVEEMGKSVNEALNLLLPLGPSVIAVMGGTTMAEIAHCLTAKLSEKRSLTFVPARGGIGETVAIQANSVSSMMARRAGGNHRALYVPEQLSEQAYAPLLNEPSIQQVVQLIRNSDAVIHSVGQAIKMARRRDMDTQVVAMLQQKRAVGEAFGYFFDESGQIVYKIPRIGVQLEDLTRMKCVIAVAGGSSKAKAIVAYMKHAPSQTWLITDEGAAKMILKK
ncbi:MAG: SorC family transcriptional regulator [Liquorilactobacillus nagelii]|jgi:central glycolytic genes regulator|uniref:sugar-binding transcriptional regulator n=1 Tax=Liquorilactobacillus nagelii TaxID=82688 RepID=UPI00242BEC36|nr:sugar-binding domain-containing protein [Liquorilactobacillus nagelii]MCI1633255.1 SorC family transcriptional regulator [Liquorilactobacillus nagelii]MCI1922544.1 SorC family transcriptional regulator [Liquorilactobacillus nagelii]MCI1978022.1 SorC family transcriptional regulator [Liquorilactobacillus nagelii]